MVASLPRKAAAEAIGTMMLIIFGPGSVMAAVVTSGGKVDYAAIGFISLSFAVVVALIIYAFGSTSGAHINPAVTIALAAGRRLPWRQVPVYVVAQLAGACVGGFLVVALFGQQAVSMGRVGLTALASRVNYAQGILGEALGTFLLLLTIMALAVDRRAPAGWAGLMIGLAVAGEIFVLGPLTGGSVNSARTLGPYVANTAFGGITPWAELGVYIIGPVIGGAAAVGVYDLVVHPVSEVSPGSSQGAAGEITVSAAAPHEAASTAPGGNPVDKSPGPLESKSPPRPGVRRVAATQNAAQRK